MEARGPEVSGGGFALPDWPDWSPKEADRRWFRNIAGQLPFLADLIPADVFLYCPRNDGQLFVVAHGRPTVRESFYRRSELGKVLGGEATAIHQAWQTGDPAEAKTGKMVAGHPMQQTVYPIRRGREILGLLVVERDMLVEVLHPEDTRQVYRTAFSRLVQTLLNRCRILEAALPSLAPGDATLILNDAGMIRHASHQATLLARKFGFAEESLEGQAWPDTFPSRGEVRTISSNGIYDQLELTGRRMALEIRLISLDPADDQVAAIAVMRDISELREKDRELAIKETIIREVHHRVKNNLQTIAGLLRLQSRRTLSSEAKTVLADCIERISSISLVHEYLSHEDVEVVDIKELAYNLMSAAVQGMHSPLTQITARVVSAKGKLTLPSAKATSTALVINELLQNTCKHAFKGRLRGAIDLTLSSRDGELLMEIRDDGIGLPQDFDPESKGHLGWHIIRTLVADDLRGTIRISSGTTGTRVTVGIPTV